MIASLQSFSSHAQRADIAARNLHTLRRPHSLRRVRALLLGLIGVGVAAGAVATPALHAQALSTATQLMSLSAFGGVTGTYTGLNALDGSGEGKNLGITAGVNLRVGSFRSFVPSLELRGTYPIHTGNVDSQKNALFGFKVEHRVLSPRAHLYGDFLFGRGQINYENGGYPTPDNSLLYAYSVSNVLSPGAGLDYDLTDRFAIKLDAQFERYHAPVTTSGTLTAKALTAGVIYRLNFNHRPKQLPDK